MFETRALESELESELEVCLSISINKFFHHAAETVRRNK